VSDQVDFLAFQFCYIFVFFGAKILLF
jgi:hypothetical protein